MTAVAKAKLPNRNITALEGLEAMRLAWAAVEEFRINLTSPMRAGGEWVANEPFGPVCGFGSTALEAVENLLRKIGGVER